MAADGSAHLPKAPSTRELALDCAFLGALVVVSLALYVGGLGFYSDDWSFLGYLTMSEGQSVAGLYRTMIEFPHKGGRPLQALSEALLFKAFGQLPLGHHLANSVVLLIGVLAFYLTLREAGLHGLPSLAAASLLAVLPNFSTTRFWMAASQANTTMALVFLCLYADLRAVRARPEAFWAWKSAAVLLLAAAALGYETFIPLLLMGPLLVWWRVGATASLHREGRRRLLRAMLPMAANLAVVAGAAAYKLSTYDRLRLEPARSFYEHAYLTGWLAEGAIRIHFIDWGIRLPSVVGRILSDRRSPEVALVAGIVGVAVFVYLTAVAGRRRRALPDAPHFALMTVAGIGLFTLGYAAFLGNYQLTFTPTGIGNRTAAAGTVGVTIVWAGLAGLAASTLRRPWARSAAYGLAISALCASGLLATNTLASYWVAAGSRAREVLARIERQLPGGPPWKTLLLDGVCPYEGPAIVFESSWDLQGALLIRYRDYALNADVVSPRLEVREDGIHTSIYKFRKRYPYDGLFVYDYSRGVLQSLPDAASARRYFSGRTAHRRGPECPHGEPGHGARVF